ncbi:MAG: type II toxin-antitoxin system death-on-curing family toxin [Gemmatimonadaceae bacterium]
MNSPPKEEDSPQWISEQILFVIHAQQIERFGGMHGVRDADTVLSALIRPLNRWAYDDTSDFADLAAVYLVGFAGAQGFNDGNKRTGLACALVFLGLNDVPLEAEPEELYQLTLRIATKKLSDPEAASWIRQHIG